MEGMGRYNLQSGASSSCAEMSSEEGILSFIPSFAADVLGNSGQNLSLAENQEGGTAQMKAWRRGKKVYIKLPRTMRSHLCWDISNTNP